MSVDSRGNSRDAVRGEHKISPVETVLYHTEGRLIHHREECPCEKFEARDCADFPIACRAIDTDRIALEPREKFALFVDLAEWRVARNDEYWARIPIRTTNYSFGFFEILPAPCNYSCTFPIDVRL